MPAAKYFEPSVAVSLALYDKVIIPRGVAPSLRLEFSILSYEFFAWRSACRGVAAVAEEPAPAGPRFSPIGHLRALRQQAT